MKDLFLNTIAYATNYITSDAVLVSDYPIGTTELVFDKPIDDSFNKFNGYINSNPSVKYLFTINNSDTNTDRKIWNISPELQSAITVSDSITKILPIKAINPEDIPSLGQISSEIRSTVIGNEYIKVIVFPLSSVYEISINITEGYKIASSELYIKSSGNSRYYKFDSELSLSSIDSSNPNIEFKTSSLITDGYLLLILTNK